MDESTQPCITCAEALPLAAFSLRTDTGRRATECRRCKVLRTKRWKADNQDRVDGNNAARNEVRRLRRLNDPRYRELVLVQERTRRRNKSAARPPLVVICERCTQSFEYRRTGRSRSVCPPCRRLDNAWRMYGLNSVTLPEFYDKHGHRCGICGGTESRTQWGNRLMVDHNHTTGELRGLLCSPCNSAIGLLGDDPVRLQAAIAYLTH